MKTKVVLLVLFCGLFLSVSAQEFSPLVGSGTDVGYKTHFKHNKSGDNWFISVAGGGSILLADWNSDATNFSDRLNIAPQVSFGKWFNPYIAFRVQFNGGPLFGRARLNDWGDIDVNGVSEDQKNTYFGAHANLLLDVTNLWAPYNAKKAFRLIPWVGMGYAQRFEKKVKDHVFERSETPSLNSGILTAFRLSDKVDLNAEIQASLLNETFNRVSTHQLSDGIVQLSVGLTYNIGKTNFEVLEPTDYNLLNDLNSKINSLRSENEELSKRPKFCPECNTTSSSSSVINKVDNVVYFRLNSSSVDKNQLVTIFSAAEFIKSNDVSVKVIGYADKNTGSSPYNKGISEKRAKAVVKLLTEKYGVPSGNISIEWKGDEVQPFNENDWNRVVIIRANN
ncbi:hypothetical protein Barb6_03239 [Bacteroidales bacterium Barb6]|nr:hypothetical protein Barb6_03239 [Bacteroidales bacterium Barb6]